MQSKRALWLAEGLIGAVAIILAVTGYVAEAVAVTAMIAATMDKLIDSKPS